jgi:hypothetical protein
MDKFEVRVSNTDLICAAADNYARLIALGFVPPFKLELGAGKFAKDLPGMVCLELNEKAGPGCHIFHDLENGIPLPDECVGYLRSGQVLEHISRDRFIHLMNETWRVMTPGALAWHSVPHFLSPYAYGDPTHKNFFTEVSFKYFCINPETGNPFISDFSDYGVECAFILEKENIVPAASIDVWLRKPPK